MASLTVSADYERKFKTRLVTRYGKCTLPSFILEIKMGVFLATLYFLLFCFQVGFRIIGSMIKRKWIKFNVSKVVSVTG